MSERGGATANGPYRICVRCVMDTSDRDIDFDADGVCNHCRTFDERLEWELPAPNLAAFELEAIVDRIQRGGLRHDYDCIVGLSGGVDSSYVAYLTTSLGLRPLAVHLDNGWDSEQAVKNIQNIVTKLGIDLYTHVVDWEEFRDIQRSYFMAGVIDIEMITDHAINAIVARTALKEGARFLLAGHNLATEAIMPESWGWRKSDLRNLRAIHGRHGTRPIRTLPTASTLRFQYWKHVRRLETIYVLNYVDYDKRKAMAILEDELGWQYYGGKHYESTFTRFYQAYILPTKFGVDKRRAHLSALVCSNQASRDEALTELELPLYEANALAEERAYVAKKLGFSEPEFEAILQAEPRSHLDYASDELYVRPLLELKRRRRERRQSKAKPA